MNTEVLCSINPPIWRWMLYNLSSNQLIRDLKHTEMYDAENIIDRTCEQLWGSRDNDNNETLMLNIRYRQLRFLGSIMCKVGLESLILTGQIDYKRDEWKQLNGFRFQLLCIKHIFLSIVLHFLLFQLCAILVLEVIDDSSPKPISLLVWIHGMRIYHNSYNLYSDYYPQLWCYYQCDVTT